MRRVTNAEIVGGMSFPHQALISANNMPGFMGSAAIIHPLLLLVSGSYVLNEAQRRGAELQVFAGGTNFTASYAQVRGVRHFVPYKSSADGKWDHEIAIVVLNQSLELYDNVRPIDLWDPTWELPGENPMVDLHLHCIYTLQEHLSH